MTGPHIKHFMGHVRHTNVLNSLTNWTVISLRISGNMFQEESQNTFKHKTK